MKPACAYKSAEQRNIKKQRTVFGTLFFLCFMHLLRRGTEHHSGLPRLRS